MKCETIKDLMPLYIDGLTSEVSNEEIQKHIETCKECRQYYHEMTGSMPEFLPKAEVDDANLIKRAQKKRKKVRVAVIGLIVLLCAVFGGAFWLYKPGSVKYDDVILKYGRNGNTIYAELKAKEGGELFFNGYTKETQDDSGRANGGTSYLKAIYVKPFAGKDNYSRWESKIKNENSEYVWTFEFADKIVVIKNGELVSEKDK